jgi:cell division protein FtsQ
MDGKKMIQTLGAIGIWIGIAIWFIVIMGFVSGRSEEVLCNRLDVILQDTVNNRFVTPGEIRALVISAEPQLQGYPLSQLNSRELESYLEKNRFIRNAEVSKDIAGRLEIRVEQRVPLVRILPEGEEGYYLDEEGKVLPLSPYFTPHILLVSGYLPGPEAAEKEDMLSEICQFCTYLSGHEFWKNQIVQIYVNRQGEYELIPRVGAHHILLGSMEQWQQKLRNLELLYNQGFSKYGWNTYGTINLKYENQVICTKR